MRVSLAHDYLTQRGGAERVAQTLAQEFHRSPLHVSVYHPSTTFPGFRDVDVRTSWLQQVPAFRRDPRYALPLLPSTWGHVHITNDEADVVLASSSGWAHGLTRDPGIPLVVYCHNPARWLYQAEDYFGDRPHLGRMFRPIRRRLTDWDQRAASRVTRYIANSTAVAERIRAAYGIEAEVIPPPMMIDTTGERRHCHGLEPGYWLTVARGRSYKNVSAVIAGTRHTGRRLVVVGAPPLGDVPSHVTYTGFISDSELRWIYAHAHALVSVSREDFGLTPLEANAFGVPVAVLRAGGFLDSTNEGVSGVFIDDEHPDSIAAALKDYPRFDVEEVKSNADRFTVERFVGRVRSVLTQAVEEG